jgi:5'-nucleotidase
MRESITRRRALRLLAIASLAASGVSLGGSAAADPAPAPVRVQVLGVSDWHGQLDPISVAGVGNVGGAAVLSAYWKADRLASPNSITMTAGDSFGATPPLAGFFNEEPAVRAMRLMGFDVDGLGNHNWDKGNAHLQQMIDIAGAPAGGSEPGTPFTYVSANLGNVEDNVAGVAPWIILERGGVKIGVVGVTNPEAPSLVFPGNFGTIEITNPVPAANKARAELLKRGVKATILIGHMGVTGFDATGQPVGPLIDLANNVGGFDVVVGDHTDVQYSGLIDGKLVIQNRSKGVTYSKLDLDINPRNGQVVGKSVSFVTPLSNAVTPDPAIVSFLAPLRGQLAAAFDAKIGVATDVFVRGGNIERRQEVPIGNLVADSMRLTYGTQLALTNGGGLRAPLPSAYVPLNPTLDRTAPPPFDLVVGDVYTVLPFGNQVVTRSVTGAQLWAALENGVSQINSATCAGTDGRFPQISGFTFTFQCSLPSGSRVLSVSLTDGTPIPNDATSYTMATNDFVNSGGDSYTVFRDGQGVSRDLMANVLLDHIEGLGTISPVVEGRITKLP